MRFLETLKEMKNLTEEQQNIILKEQMIAGMKRRFIFSLIGFLIMMLTAAVVFYEDRKNAPQSQEVDAFLTMEELGYRATQVDRSVVDPVVLMDNEIGKVYVLAISNPLGSADHVAWVNLWVYDVDTESSAQAVYEQVILEYSGFEEFDQVISSLYKIESDHADSVYCKFELHAIPEEETGNKCYIKRGTQFAELSYSKHIEMNEEHKAILFGILDRFKE